MVNTKKEAHAPTAPNARIIVSLIKSNQYCISGTTYQPQLIPGSVFKSEEETLYCPKNQPTSQVKLSKNLSFLRRLSQSIHDWLIQSLTPRALNYQAILVQQTLEGGKTNSNHRICYAKIEI